MNGLDLQIEELKKKTGLTYIDAILEFAEGSGLDFEDIVKEIHFSILDKIKQEYIERNMVDGRDAKGDKWKSKRNETGMGEFF